MSSLHHHHDAVLLHGDPDPDDHHRREKKIATSDPYVTASVAGATIARTRIIRNSQSPVWSEHFKVPLAHSASDLIFHVKDDDLFGAQIIGTVTIPAALVASGEAIEGWLPVIVPSGRQPKTDTALRVSLQFTPVELTKDYRHGIAGDPEKSGVRNVYFPVRRGCSTTLYQDAHDPPRDQA